MLSLGGLNVDNSVIKTKGHISGSFRYLKNVLRANTCKYYPDLVRNKTVTKLERCCFFWHFRSQPALRGLAQ